MELHHPFLQQVVQIWQAKQARILLGGIVAGVVGIAASLSLFVWSVTADHRESSALSQEELHQGNLENFESPNNGTLVAEVSGAVLHPGVYTLPQESRVEHLLEKAGGFTPQADWEYVSEHFNLAQKLQDEAKLFIPFQGKTTQITPQLTSSPSDLVSINTASLTQLDQLPGVGEKTAQKIIDRRPYAKKDDLVKKKVVSTTAFSKLESLISL